VINYHAYDDAWVPDMRNSGGRSASSVPWWRWRRMLPGRTGCSGSPVDSPTPG